MMNVDDLERAHLTLAFLYQIPEATDVDITFLPDTEEIKAVVRMTDGEVRHFTFEIGSDDDEYVFINDDCPPECVTTRLLPSCLTVF